MNREREEERGRGDIVIILEGGIDKERWRGKEMEVGVIYKSGGESWSEGEERYSKRGREGELLFFASLYQVPIYLYSLSPLSFYVFISSLSMGIYLPSYPIYLSSPSLYLHLFPCLSTFISPNSLPPSLHSTIYLTSLSQALPLSRSLPPSISTLSL